MWKAISFLRSQYFDILFVGCNSVCIDLWIFLMFVHIRWYFKYHVLSVPGRPPEASIQPAANQYPVHDPEVYPEVYPEVCSEGYPAGRVMGQGRFRTIAGPIQATSLLIFVVLCLYVLKYLMMCVNSCWYLVAFNDIYIYIYIWPVSKKKNLPPGRLFQCYFLPFNISAVSGRWRKFGGSMAEDHVLHFSCRRKLAEVWRKYGGRWFILHWFLMFDAGLVNVSFNKLLWLVWSLKQTGRKPEENRKFGGRKMIPRGQWPISPSSITFNAPQT